MNKFEARSKLGDTVRLLLMDMLDEGTSTADTLELESSITVLVDALFEEWQLGVVSVEAPFATVRLSLDAE